MKHIENTHLLMIHFDFMWILKLKRLKWIFIIDFFYLELDLIMLIHFEIYLQILCFPVEDDQFYWFLVIVFL